MKLRDLLEEYGIPYVADGTHHHNTSGWLNVHCPFCASTNFHLGLSEDGRAGNCWRCGPHSVAESLARILGVPEFDIRRRLRELDGGATRTVRSEPRVAVRSFRFPRPHSSLTESGRRYLIERGYDPDEIEERWGVLQTGPVSFLDRIPYGNRLIIPIRWNGRVVSFQARDITGRSEAKYLACPRERERIHHKHIVYGRGLPRRSRTLIVVEGPLDVWRLGGRAVATFGIKFTMEQVLTIADLADKFLVLYDAEPQAQEQARLLAAKLRALGKRSKVVHLHRGDPGDLSPDEARTLVRELVGGTWQ